MPHIKLHPKYGLNPSMALCFWCGKTRGDILLLGNKLKDEAPREMLVDYEPCEKCDAYFKSGITLIGASEKPHFPKQKPITQEPQIPLYPTGTFCVMKPSAIEKVFDDPEHVAQVKKHGRAYVPVSFVESLIEASRPQKAPSASDILEQAPRAVLSEGEKEGLKTDLPK